MSDIGDWFKSVPPITRTWFGASIAFPLIGVLRLVDFRNFLLFPELVFNKFHLWRPFTATFYFPTGFLYLVNLYFLYQYSTRLETGVFDGRPADYIFMLLFNWICVLITGMLMNMRIFTMTDLLYGMGIMFAVRHVVCKLLMIPLIMSVLYIWAQFNKDMIVTFWFGTRFKAHYLPWVILIFNFIIGGSFVDELTGNLVGHLYYFLMFKYPIDLGGRSFLSTPEILYRYFPNRRGGVSGFGVPPTRRAAAQEPMAGGGGGGRHNWGEGFRLGDD